MSLFTKRRPSKILLCLTIITSVICSPISAYENGVALELHNSGVPFELSNQYIPILLKGVSINSENPFEFDFIIDSGHSDLTDVQIQKESERLIKYFMASLTIPEDDVWVNLSPYEKNRIIPNELGKTLLGRDLLEQDYVLKQVTSDLLHPEKELGKKFWNEIHNKVYSQFGMVDLPVDSLSKVWIVPEKASIYEDHNGAYVTEAYLKVMLDKDVLALSESFDKRELSQEAAAAQVMKDIIVPAIEKEVNKGKNFAQLRQVFHSLILGKWYKETIKESLLAQVYVNQNKINGVDVSDKNIKEKIYAKYVEAFKKGSFNFIKEDYDQLSKQIIPRKYFSGGMDKLMTFPLGRSDFGMVGSPEGRLFRAKVDGNPLSDGALLASEALQHIQAAEEEWSKVIGPGDLWRKDELADFMENVFDPEEALKMGPIFVPRAFKQNEARMGLTPVLIKLLRALGVKNDIYIESDSGINRYTKEKYFSDQEYTEVGATVLDHDAFVAKAKEVGKKVVVSIKEPQPEEYYFLDDALLYTYLHIAADADLTQVLLDRVTSAVAYETILYDKNGINKTPVLAPASHAAGYVSAIRYAIYEKYGKDSDQETLDDLFLSAVQDYPSVSDDLKDALKGKIVTSLGGGASGEAYAIAAAQMGAKVYITEANLARIKELEETIESKGLSEQIQVLHRKDTTQSIELEEDIWKIVTESNAINASILIEGAKAPKEITQDLYQKLVEAGNLEFISDISIDQGGNFETSVKQEYAEGWIVDDNFIGQFSVTNMPSVIPLHVSFALERAKVAYLMALLMGPKKAVKAFPELASGFNVHKGKVVHLKVAEDTNNMDKYVAFRDVAMVVENAVGALKTFYQSITDAERTSPLTWYSNEEFEEGRLLVQRYFDDSFAQAETLDEKIQFVLTAMDINRGTKGDLRDVLFVLREVPEESPKFIEIYQKIIKFVFFSELRNLRWDELTAYFLSLEALVKDHLYVKELLDQFLSLIESLKGADEVLNVFRSELMSLEGGQLDFLLGLGKYADSLPVGPELLGHGNWLSNRFDGQKDRGRVAKLLIIKFSMWFLMQRLALDNDVNNIQPDDVAIMVSEKAIDGGIKMGDFMVERTGDKALIANDSNIFGLFKFNNFGGLAPVIINFTPIKEIFPAVR